MRSAGLLVLFILGLSGSVNSQITYSSELRTFTLTSPYVEDGHGKLKKSTKADSNCFDFVSESEVRCRQRWDLVYGNMRAGEEWDWFLVPGSTGVRSKMISLGKRNWDDAIKVKMVEPYPELEPGKGYNVSVDASGQDGAPGKPGSNGADGASGMDGSPGEQAVSVDAGLSADRGQAVDTGEIHLNKAAVSTSSHLVKAVKGNMYLIRVKDAANDFYVLLRVDDLVRGRNATISWRRIEPPRAKKWKQL